MLAAAIACLAACVSSHVLIGKPRPPISPDQVTVYTQPPASYEQIARLDSSSRSSFSFGAQAKTNKVIERLKQEAAKLGANGVLLQGISDQQSGSIGTGAGFRERVGKLGRRSRSGYLVRYLSEGRDWSGDLRCTQLTGAGVGRLILVRHGESEGNRDRIFAIDPTGLPLTPLGYQQARAIAHEIAANFRVEAVIASPFLRARETARVIAEFVGLSSYH